jgi:hypothetical protein
MAAFRIMKRDTREMLELSGFFTLCIFPIFGAFAIVAIIVEAILKALF